MNFWFLSHSGQLTVGCTISLADFVGIPSCHNWQQLPTWPFFVAVEGLQGLSVAHCYRWVSLSVPFKNTCFMSTRLRIEINFNYTNH